MRAKQASICIWVFGMNIMNDNSANVIWGVRKMNVFQHSSAHNIVRAIYINSGVSFSPQWFSPSIFRMRYHLIGKLLLLSLRVSDCLASVVMYGCIVSLRFQIISIFYTLFFSSILIYLLARISHTQPTTNEIGAKSSSTFFEHGNDAVCARDHVRCNFLVHVCTFNCVFCFRLDF